MKNNRAQSILEYAVLLGIIAMAFGVMQLYFKRSIQSVVKVAADQVGRQSDAEEIDVLRGRRSDSETKTHSTSAVTAATETGGRTRFTVSSTSETTGKSIYLSEEKE